MGCCFSTPNSNQPQNELLQQNCKIRIPQPLEEEYVKEVLSETPISKLQQIPTFKPQIKTQLPVIQPPEVPVKKALEPEEVSLVSETCSNGESFSTTTTTATTTVTENREDEATSKRSNATRNRKRSYAVDGNRISSRERRQKSPARKPEIPVRSRPVPRRDSDQVRRLSGGGSIRRSRSPSRGGRSNIRPPTRQVPVTKDGVQRNDGVSVKESLENPHVSLECFIFL
ncbi:uncharacterized protein LOC106754249 [Vigna radiata var. radiata]|uniref:Uncharacterized protein LOC106754249 n=1 Tax=Vigna radiata var. radiata TaxID=3916 RepID=A0A1S3TD88_VIGRR|nr:uncharacterized protein LOC106754249 [Vigna radiata var. radiata]